MRCKSVVEPIVMSSKVTPPVSIRGLANGARCARARARQQCYRRRLRMHGVNAEFVKNKFGKRWTIPTAPSWKIKMTSSRLQPSKTKNLLLTLLLTSIQSLTVRWRRSEKKILSTAKRIRTKTVLHLLPSRSA